MVVPYNPPRHERFYFPSVAEGASADLVIFLVNGKLYRVYRHPLEKNSAVFAAMFAVPQDRSTHEVEGLSDEHPIHLDGIPVEEFEALLHALYPIDLNAHVNLFPHVWLTSLAAAARWEIPSLRNLALFHIERAGAAARLTAARRHGEERWLRPALDELCRRDEGLTAAELVVLEAVDAAYITSVREAALFARLKVVGSPSKLSELGNYITQAMARFAPP